MQKAETSNQTLPWDLQIKSVATAIGVFIAFLAKTRAKKSGEDYTDVFNKIGYYLQKDFSDTLEDYLRRGPKLN